MSDERDLDTRRRKHVVGVPRRHGAHQWQRRVKLLRRGLFPYAVTLD